MGMVMTVLGLVDSSELGKTLMHEHIICDFTCFLLEPKNDQEATFMDEPVSLKNLWSMRVNPYANRDNCILNDVDQSLREIEIFKEFGGRTIVEVTLEGAGRDVEKLVKVSKLSGINIVAGAGHYTYETHPPRIKNLKIDDLAQEYINEFKNGIGDTGIKPGIIGEIGTGAMIHPEENKILRAASRAQIETGMAITIHTDPEALRGHEILDILIKEEGVNPEKIILGHRDFALTQRNISCDEGIDHLLSLANRGCYLEFDLCGNTTIYKREKGYWFLPTDYQRAEAIAKLCRSGFSDKVLLSQDIGIKHFLREFGGWGYSHVLNEFQNYLMEVGISPHISRLFNLDNPARVLSID